ncbi:MAG TPA: hypothetical protein VE153_33505 [Myxococcus sp.]|nr:hypothetical protein [Myxococcus sp.]
MVELGSHDALPQVFSLPPAGAALDDSGYSLRGTGADAIACALGSPEGLIGEVTRLSPTVVWVRPSGPMETWESRTPPVYLTGFGLTLGPLRGAFIRTNTELAHSPVGLQLVGVSLEQGRQILSLLREALRRGLAEPGAPSLPVQDLIEHGERIRSILGAICASSNEGMLRREGRPVRLVLERLHPASAQLEWRAEAPVDDWGDAPFELDVIGYNSAYRMRLESGTAVGDRLFTPLPERLFRIRHRWHRRAPAPAGASVRFHHPLWRELGELDREVADLSFSGLAIRCRPEDLVFPGLLPPRLEMHTGNGQVIPLRGEIRHVSGPREDGTVLCGLSALPYSSDEARWVRFVSQTLSPATRTGEDLEDGLWELFTRSGFFSLAGKSAEEFEALRRDFRQMTKRAAEVPQLFCQAVRPSERGIEATMSFMKPYRHAWMGHQVAKRPGKPPASVQEPGRIMRDLYLRAFEHPQSDPDFRWVVAYVEASNPWIAKAHVRYAERQMDAAPGLAFTRKVRMMDVLTQELTGLCHEDVRVGPATPDELELLADTVAFTRPGCYVDALDFTRERLDLRAMQARWRQFGLEREREVLVARRDGEPVAAAVLELGQQGTNLYSLLDMARLFPFHADGPSTYAALMDAARRWYGARRRTSFHYLCEDEGGAYVREAGLHEGPEPHLWILSSKLVPDFLEHISELTIGRRGALPPRQGQVS